MDTDLPARPRLRLLNGPGAGEMHELDPGGMTIGSAPTSDIVVAHEAVAANHARVVPGADGTTIRDLGSSRGTWVNYSRIVEAILRDGDRVRVGESVFEFLSSADLERGYVTHEQLSSAAVDDLTGVFNRGFFEEALTREIHRARRYAGPLALAILDVDQFRRCNEIFGQDTGDRVLRELADIVVERANEIDVVARARDDEFAIVLIGRSLADATSFAQALGGAIEQHQFVERVRLTVSFGVAELEPEQTDDALLDLVGARLRRAKALGCNRVVGPPD